jgi:hypothetical protein
VKRLGMARAGHALASPKATKKPEIRGPCQSAMHNARSDSGCENVGPPDSRADLLRNVGSISADPGQHH